jgi:ABC-type sugar transport system ATPase subunit
MLAHPAKIRHMQRMTEPVIAVDDLVKRYGQTLAVGGISFAVTRGVTAALLGGNGAG